jgi:hypothetical protein
MVVLSEDSDLCYELTRRKMSEICEIGEQGVLIACFKDRVLPREMSLKLQSNR